MLIYYIMCSSLFQLINSFSLLNLPLKLPSGLNVIIHSTLTHTVNGKQWFLEEYLSTTNSIHGKIHVYSDQKAFDIFYENTNDNQRLVIHDNQCDLFKFNNEEYWDTMLPEVDSSLINTILLIGPSLIYRLQDGVNDYVKGKGTIKMVRGVKMDNLFRKISSELKITIYHQLNLDIETALKEPKRIEFDDYNLVLDITSHAISDDYLNTETQVTPGIGCPVYLKPNKPIPKLTTQQIHLIVKEKLIHSNSQSISTSEIYADDEKQLLTIKVNNVSTKVFDYNLGLVYDYHNNLNCQFEQIDSNGPGLVVNDYKSTQFDLYQLLEMRRPLRYLGQVDYKLRSAFTIDAWESMEYKVNFNQVYYDKLVVTVYMGRTRGETGFTSDGQDYLPLAIVINGYNNTKGRYYLSFTIERDIYDYASYFTESQAKSVRQSINCLTTAKTMQLVFNLVHSDANQLIEDNIERIKSSLVNEIIKDGRISPLRIENIDLQLKSINQMSAFMTLLEAPSVEDIFTTQLRRLDVSQISQSSGIHVDSLEKCLQIQSSLDETIRAIVYCSEDEIVCSSVANGDKLVDDVSNGHLCLVIESQLGKLYQIGQQIRLESLHDYLLKSTVNSVLKIPIRSNYSMTNGQYINLQITDIIDSSSSSLTYNQQFDLIGPIKGVVLKDEHIDLPFTMTNGYFGDCYRSCDQLNCNSFSYCQSDNQKICKLSTQLMISESNLTMDADYCKTFHRNSENHFHRIKSRQFKEINSDPTKVIQSNDCASLCLNDSANCYSYQYCQSTGLCYFAGYYSEQVTQSSKQCDIYTPKKSSNYHLTGSNIIVNTNHVELNLNIDQCAALCSGQDADQCKSFNYCGKSRSGLSLCSLSNWTINDQSNVNLVKSETCRNYELIVKSIPLNDQQQSNEYNLIKQFAKIKLDLVLIYILSGLLIGSVVTLTVTKIIEIVGQSRVKGNRLSQEQQFEDIFGL